MRILVADDAPSVRKLLRLILEPAHVVIEAATAMTRSAS